jgi:hypothetical protein
MGSAGVDNTSALCMSGLPPPDGNLLVEQWNGTSWTEIADINDGRWELSGNGTVTSALIYGGTVTPTTNTGATESWNGTSWTEVSDLNQARREAASSGASNSSAIVFGGEINTPAGPVIANTELWDGTSWTETSDMNTARNNLGGNGTTTSSLAYGGGIPANTAATEEWTGAGSSVTRTFTDS